MEELLPRGANRETAPFPLSLQIVSVQETGYRHCMCGDDPESVGGSKSDQDGMFLQQEHDGISSTDAVNREKRSSDKAMLAFPNHL